MSYTGINHGKDIPNDINVVIEISSDCIPVKYEVDKDSGALMVDRFLSSAMHYPCNYGYIPNTLCGDGDPADALVVTPYPLQPGSVIRCRPLGLLLMEDEAGQDSKLVVVPITKLTGYYDKVDSINDLPKELLNKISHFFEHYKDLEEGKWVKVNGWGNINEAHQEIINAIKNFKKTHHA